MSGCPANARILTVAQCFRNPDCFCHKRKWQSLKHRTLLLKFTVRSSFCVFLPCMNVPQQCACRTDCISFLHIPTHFLLNLYSVEKRLESAQVFLLKCGESQPGCFLLTPLFFSFLFLPSNIFAVCVCKGTHPERSNWKRSCQQRIICWHGRKPRRCPSKESTRRLTRTRRWLSSNLDSL